MSNGLIVGERFNMNTWRPANPRVGLDPDYEWRLRVRLGCFKYGSARTRLKKIGLRVNDWDGINLTYPDPQSTPFDREAADAFWRRHSTRIWTYSVVLLLGREVQRVAGMHEAGLCETTRPRDLSAMVVVMPHPSGRNRWWNDPLNVERARRAIANVNKYKERS